MERRLCFCVVLFLGLWACSPVKEYMAKAEESTKSANYEEASNYYYNILLKKKNYKPAQVKLKETAQKVLNEKFTVFSKLVLENKVEEAIRQYINARKYTDNALSVGVTLDWPYEYEEVYNDLKAEYVLKLYDNAIDLMNKNQYDAAEKVLEKMASYDSSYAGATVLRLNTVVEPLYKRACGLMMKEDYKNAYITFEKIEQLDNNYKDVKQKKAQALEKATVSLLILPPVNNTAYMSITPQMSQKLYDVLNTTRSTYIKVSETAKTNLELQNKGWTDIRNVSLAIDAAKNLNYKYVLLIQVVNADSNISPLAKVVRPAFEAYTENILNPITGTYTYISKFKKVSYNDTYEAIKMKMKFQYKLINVSDSKVLAQDEFEAEQSDEQHALSFDGNINNLYEELPKGNYLPPPNTAWRDMFTIVPRKISSGSHLASLIGIDAAETIAYKVSSKLK